MKIGVVGCGFVGKATKNFASTSKCLVYDINPDLCCPKGLQFSDLYEAQVIFVCVPTPMNKDNSVHIDIVKDTVTKLKDIVEKNCPIIVRSTVPPGTCDDLNVFFMPEFLTEKNFIEDFKNTNNWIIGYPENYNLTQKIRIEYIIEKAFKNKYIFSEKIHFVKNKEAEMIKYFKNSFLATKVSFCNEIYQFCKKREIDYDTVIDHVCLDNRINKSHTQVPGHDGKFGFGGTCFPKDCEGLLSEFIKHDVKSIVLKSSLERNKTIDRVDQEWNLDVGRAVL